MRWECFTSTDTSPQGAEKMKIKDSSTSVELDYPLTERTPREPCPGPDVLEVCGVMLPTDFLARRGAKEQDLARKPCSRLLVRPSVSWCSSSSSWSSTGLTSTAGQCRGLPMRPCEGPPLGQSA